MVQRKYIILTICFLIIIIFLQAIQNRYLNYQLSELQYERTSMLEELSAYRIIIDPPEKVGEIDIGTIMNLIRTRITQNGGSAGSSYDITTRDEIERFLAHVKYPSGMDRSAKLWWLMGKVMEWAGPTFTIGYYRVSMYDTGICVITLDNREYGIYRVDLDELQLDSIELGDYDSFVVYFPYENRGR